MKNKFVILTLLFALIMSSGIATVCVADTEADKAYWQRAITVGIVSEDTNPSDIITYEEFVHMLWKIGGKEEPGIDYSFSDLGTNDPITNEMAYVMAVHSWNLMPIDSNSYKNYKDANLLSEWAQMATSVIFERGLSSSQTMCNPQHAITYGETVSLLSHFNLVEYFQPLYGSLLSPYFTEDPSVVLRAELTNLYDIEYIDYLLPRYLPASMQAQGGST